MTLIKMVPETFLVWVDFVTFWANDSFRFHMLGLYVLDDVGFYTRIIETFITLP